MDGVQGYDEDQIALVIPDELKFMEQIPVILGTPTISHIINVMKEKEIDALAMPWVNARVAHLLSVHRAVATVVGDETTERINPNGYDEVVILTNMETIDAFSSHIISIKVEKAYTGECINVMTQLLWTKDGPLPQGLTIQNAYTELRKGSKNAVVVARNSTAYPQIMKESSSGQGSGCNCSARTTTRDQGVGGRGWTQNPHIPNLTLRQRQGKLFEELDLSVLDSWSPELVDTAHRLLAEYHDVFSLEPLELGYTHSTKHTIRVTDDTPFKE